MPVMIRATTGKKVKFYANAGPYIGFIAKAKVQTNGSSMLYRDITGQLPDGSNGSHTIYSLYGNQTTTSSFNTVSFGLTGGVGVGYSFGKHCIVFDTRYEVGLTNIRNNTSVNGKNNLQTLMVGLGYNYVLFR